MSNKIIHFENNKHWMDAPWAHWPLCEKGFVQNNEDINDSTVVLVKDRVTCPKCLAKLAIKRIMKENQCKSKLTF